ncbi:MAG TPA: GerMN domain-containing protein, partial [Ilumatobacteraceae bacterium]|nr:GerMN domain-containing protein [Ilumatobacteraceae bacterium]
MRWALVPLTAMALAACGIDADSQPRDIPPDRQVELAVDTDRSPGVATGLARVYLIAPGGVGSTDVLDSVARDVDETPEDLLGALLEGPNETEFEAEFRTAIPEGTVLRSAVLRGGTLRVDVSDELLQLSGETLIDAIAQLVFTSSEIDGVRSVKIVVEGADQQWPAGN